MISRRYNAGLGARHWVYGSVTVPMPGRASWRNFRAGSLVAVLYALSRAVQTRPCAPCCLSVSQDATTTPAENTFSPSLIRSAHNRRHGRVNPDTRPTYKIGGKEQFELRIILLTLLLQLFNVTLGLPSVNRTDGSTSVSLK